MRITASAPFRVSVSTYPAEMAIPVRRPPFRFPLAGPTRIRSTGMSLPAAEPGPAFHLQDLANAIQTPSSAAASGRPACCVRLRSSAAPTVPASSACFRHSLLIPCWSGALWVRIVRPHTLRTRRSGAALLLIQERSSSSSLREDVWPAPAR